jgi:hypothetical protein
MPRRTQAWYDAYQARTAAREKTGDPGDCPPGKEVALLHAAIIDHCRANRWLFVRSRTDTPATQRCGVPDFIILPGKGLTLWFECKTRSGKLRPTQRGFIAWAASLEVHVHVVRSLKQFILVVEDGLRYADEGRAENPPAS